MPQFPWQPCQVSVSQCMSLTSWTSLSSHEDIQKILSVYYQMLFANLCYHVSKNLSLAFSKKGTTWQEPGIICNPRTTLQIMTELKRKARSLLLHLFSKQYCSIDHYRRLLYNLNLASPTFQGTRNPEIGSHKNSHLVLLKIQRHCTWWRMVFSCWFNWSYIRYRKTL